MPRPTPVPTPRRSHRAGRARAFPNARMVPDTWGPLTRVQTACRARAAGPVQERGWGRRPVGPRGRVEGGAGLRRGCWGTGGRRRLPHGVPSGPRGSRRQARAGGVRRSSRGLPAGNFQAESRGHGGAPRPSRKRMTAGGPGAACLAEGGLSGAKSLAELQGSVAGRGGRGGLRGLASGAASGPHPALVAPREARNLGRESDLRKRVVVPQWGRAGTAPSPPDERLASRSVANPRASPQGGGRSRGERGGRPRDGAPHGV